MTTTRIFLTLCALVLLTCAPARSDDPDPAAEPQPGGDRLKLDQYYGDAVSQIGSFPGTLVCISTKQPFVPENVTPCGSDKVYALALTKPDAVVPLVGAAQRTADQFPLLLDRKVVVRGKHYPDKGMIAVGSIESVTTAADAPAQPAAHKPSALGH
jgi:hypothetical protein